MKRHQQALKEQIKTHVALPQKVLIKHLNARIRGWTSYYSAVCAKRCFTQMDTYLFQALWQWSKRRHPNKSAKWRAKTYWHPEQGKWQFACPECSLRLHRMTPIKRHVKVQGATSPFRRELDLLDKATGEPSRNSAEDGLPTQESKRKV